jgi:purine nucleoside permease
LHNHITVTGFSLLFPHAHCNSDYSICQVTPGEAEINIASSITALYLSPIFDLTKTYFLIGGIAGVEPYGGTLGSVAFARYAIQVALQYEIDAREIPWNWTTGYFPLSAFSPTEYPESIYGTEVFELNLNLRAKAMSLASKIERL